MDETTFDVSPDKWVGINLVSIALVQIQNKLKKHESVTSLKLKSKEKGCDAFCNYYFLVAQYLDN